MKNFLIKICVYMMMPSLAVATSGADKNTGIFFVLVI